MGKLTKLRPKLEYWLLPIAILTNTVAKTIDQYIPLWPRSSEKKILKPRNLDHKPTKKEGWLLFSLSLIKPLIRPTKKIKKIDVTVAKIEADKAGSL